MADLSVNQSDTVTGSEDVGQNLLKNGGFESAPSFTAATTTSSRFIDGTAGGSTTNDIYFWQTYFEYAASAQFDNSTSNSGTNSLNITTAASPPSGAHQTSVYLGPNNGSASNLNKYCIPIYPSVIYKITFSIKTSGITTGNSEGAFLNVTTFSADGSGSTAAYNSAFVSGTNNWATVSSTFTNLSTRVFARIACLIKGEQGTAWFDDIILQRVTPDTGPHADMNPVVTPTIQTISGPKIWS